MFFAIVAGVVAYFATLLILLLIFIPLREHVQALAVLRVPPYSTLFKWSILAVAWYAAYRAFIAAW
ncbi:hypothetical protein [Brucella pituitosa]|uniref:Uncharacterized protein n=1 Tax=Brucella pituitosa TaxID=571256 RepID=A0A643F5F2_9HYPH|nr:hypothetical protein [Brucella pituitosa]KAB0573124.1 hypothetical protein F7Q93_01085 [Brucella pituitosa]